MKPIRDGRRWAKDAVQAAGLRATSARIATLLVLRDAKGPLSHADVSARLVDQQIDHATVFRNLSDMVAADLIRRSEFGDHVWRFELASDDRDGHPRFVCVDCGTITAVEEVELTKQSQSMSERVGQITEILLRGHCSQCV